MVLYQRRGFVCEKGKQISRKNIISGVLADLDGPYFESVGVERRVMSRWLEEDPSICYRPSPIMETMYLVGGVA